MNKHRLEAFSDGVLAIVITIMVLEIKVQHGDKLSDLRALIPVFVSYVLSFIYLAIYWNNHHHMMHAIEQVNGKILWANMHLLFWLSLVPFTTGWVGENNFSEIPMALYGSVLFMCAVAFMILQKSILENEGEDSLLGKAVGNNLKEKISIACYLGGIIMSFFIIWVAGVLYIFVALLWLLPDRRIEKAMKEDE